METCTRDEECSNTMACTNKQCQSYGSLEDLMESDNSLACKSGFIKEVTVLDSETKSVCVPAPRIINKQGPDFKCATPQDTCLYEVSSSTPSVPSFTFETPCACGLTPTGASFCPTIYTKTYPTLMRRVTEKFGQECHTTDRLNIYECLTNKRARHEIRSEEDLKLLNDFIVEHFERTANNQVRENDQCMKSHSQVS